MVLVHPARPVRRRRAAPRSVDLRTSAALRRASVPARRDGSAWSLVSRGLDRVPAGWWRVTALYLAGRYLVLVAAFAVVLLDPRGAAATLAPLRGVGEVAVLLSGAPVTAAVLGQAALGWVLVIGLRALLLRGSAPRLARSVPLLVGASALTAALSPLPTALLVVAVLAALGVLRLLRGTAVR